MISYLFCKKTLLNFFRFCERTLLNLYLLCKKTLFNFVKRLFFLINAFEFFKFCRYFNFSLGKLIVGSGNGEIAILDSKYKREASCQLRGSVMSLVIRGNGHQIFCGTSENNVYRINIG